MIIIHLSHAASANLAPLAQGSSPDIPWLRIVLVFILCVGLAVAAIGFVRLRHGLPFLPDRLGNSPPRVSSSGDMEDHLAVSQRLSAGPSSQFVILARGKQRYLLYVSPQGVTEIDRYEDRQAGSGK